MHVTPDAVKSLFDGNIMAIMFVWGLVVKYHPKLAKWDNDAIPWMNTVLYCVSHLAVSPVAAAGFFNVNVVPDAVGVLVGGFLNSGATSMLYNLFGKPLLEKLLGLKKAVPAPTLG